MDLNEVMDALYQFGNEGTKRIYMNHGAQEPFFGVKVGDLKKLQKKIKTNHQLALELYDTGNSDAQYLAGMIADPKLATKEELNDWAKGATWYMVSDYAVAGVAASSNDAWSLGLEWIQSDQEFICSAGWCTLAGYISIRNDDEIDLLKIEELLTFAENHIHEQQNRVRYSLNGFVIAVGVYIESLSEKAMEVGKNIGKVSVNMGKTSCKVPMAEDYIFKVRSMDRVGKKKKSTRC
ncbi:DNA alkylation repair protein [Flammeovirga yaeyamensis]|uniref:DNA alkylation repair protein n=1 Tax=Flammeovirga yaeyamensis TaxID=367791 RepID=A0AAX1N6X4_9BACT|nr:DNA alkylation repair protein [Flammeovirga yaeyamensis]MBB3697787.1 3-methyladenine DNA glycosylase AlkD [Flammeovirga yaeyamensis]NMF35857.1 DNA alkylation repair protein [Flammeovirga yaeyamensis]QWG03192.1 DNA alkylation repair protein [Flammeovirga yaeyamensis]